jgi:hypothetical protein
VKQADLAACTDDKINANNEAKALAIIYNAWEEL